METNDAARQEHLQNISALLEIVGKLQLTIAEKPVIVGRITVASALWTLPARARTDS